MMNGPMKPVPPVSSTRFTIGISGMGEGAGGSKMSFLSLLIICFSAAHCSSRKAARE